MKPVLNAVIERDTKTWPGKTILKLHGWAEVIPTKREAIEYEDRA